MSLVIVVNLTDTWPNQILSLYHYTLLSKKDNFLSLRLLKLGDVLYHCAIEAFHWFPVYLQLMLSILSLEQTEWCPQHFEYSHTVSRILSCFLISIPTVWVVYLPRINYICSQICLWHPFFTIIMELNIYCGHQQYIEWIRRIVPMKKRNTLGRLNKNKTT